MTKQKNDVSVKEKVESKVDSHPRLICLLEMAKERQMRFLRPCYKIPTGFATNVYDNCTVELRMALVKDATPSKPRVLKLGYVDPQGVRGQGQVRE